jgi:pyrrolidone-carboxylate peptidase
MKVLLVSFGPFMAKDGTWVKQNITRRITTDLAINWQRIDCDLTVLRLSSSLEVTREALVKSLIAYHPDLVLCLGHAKGYKALTLETRFFNRFSARLESERKLDGPIEASGAAYYDTNVPCVAGLVKYLQSCDIPAIAHCGPEGMDYLCNFAGYVVAHSANTRPGGKFSYLLIQIPSKDDLPYEISLEGIRRAIHFLTNPL